MTRFLSFRFVPTVNLIIFASLLFLLLSANDSTEAKRGKKINLSKRGLTEIPDFVFENPEDVRVLNLFGNKLDHLDKRIGLLVNLEKLYLGRNDLKELCPEIGQLKNLKLFSAQYNEIDTLPAEIGQMTNLEQLWLDQNQLRHIPENLGELKNLSVLKLNFNQLFSLPENLGDCENLGFIYLNRNNLYKIPESVSKLSQLKEIYLSRAGPLLDIPESMCDLRFLELLEVDRSIRLPPCLLVLRANRLKIVVN